MRTHRVAPGLQGHVHGGPYPVTGVGASPPARSVKPTRSTDPSPVTWSRSTPNSCAG
jgi:hypothetical protein